MTEEMKIEELLNSYIDGELSVRQRTEVKRLAANDPKIARRLRELQKCRTLVSALPIVNAPSHIMENVKASLERKNLIQENAPVHISDYREVKTSRRVLAAAAMFTLTALLVVVITMLTPTDIGINNGIQPVAIATISGRLELKANDFKGVDSKISRAIKDNGLAENVSSVKDGNRCVYTLSCSREGLNNILTDLEGDWDKLYSAKFSLDTDIFSESVKISSVMPSQILKIVNQKDADQSIKIAKDISVINSLNELLNDRGIPAYGSNTNLGFLRIPQPIITSNPPSLYQDNGEKTIQLRIILSR